MKSTMKLAKYTLNVVIFFLLAPIGTKGDFMYRLFYGCEKN